MNIKWRGVAMIATLLILAATLWNRLGEAPGFTLDVQGAVTTSASGSAESGPTGTPAGPFYTVTLGGPDGAAAVVFTRADSVPPEPGVYQVGEAALSRGGFSGLVITGMPARPTGVFRVGQGTLTITSVTSKRLTGRFVLEAAGFQTERPEDEGRNVRAGGAFIARAVDRDANLSLKRGPGQ